jgi:hypothetical protein
MFLQSGICTCPRVRQTSPREPHKQKVRNVLVLAVSGAMPFPSSCFEQTARLPRFFSIVLTRRGR